VVLLEEVSAAWRMATVGISTAAATSRMRAIFFEVLHLQGNVSSNMYSRDKSTILNITPT
jgi:hypothetical protein